ncbi:MAG: hypothetical protein ACRDT6_15335 [Micromonosporaceae bacterium]
MNPGNRPPGWLRSRGVTGAAAILAAGFILATLVWPQVGRAPDPERVVRDYLEAIRARDVPLAGRISTPSLFGRNPFDDWDSSAALREPDALRTDWRVRSVDAEPDGERDGDRWRVQVTIEAADGATQSGVFTVEESWDHNRLTIKEPLATLIVIAPDALKTLHLNGIPLSPYGGRDEVRLLPGVYELSAGTPALFGNTTRRIVVVSGSQLKDVNPAVTDAARGKLREQFASFLTRCRAAEDGELPSNCPVKPFAPSGADLSKNTIRYRWKVLQQPQLTVSFGEKSLTADTVAHPGKARVEAIADNGAREIRTVAMRPIRADIAVDPETGKVSLLNFEVAN